MLQRQALGTFPPKHHITHYEDGHLLMEQMITREGFVGPYSIVYYRIPPTDECAVEPTSIPGFAPFELADDQSLKRRHVKTQDLAPKGDFLTGRRTLMVNEDVHMGVCKPNQPAERFFSNGDGDELYFVKSGKGTLESLYGVLPFREHDYILIPKGTPYRLHLEGNSGTLLIFEGRPRLGIPKDYRNSWGQLTDFAPYCHRDFGVPQALLEFDSDKHGEAPYSVVMKRKDALTVHQYQHFPFDIAGWDGVLYPVTFNIHDYQPKTGQVHLPPTIHITFDGPGFVVCSFVPRVVDFHEKAIPCPYGHASVDMDEILYYVAGNFTSRRGIDSESVSFHPQGVAHGPHPGAYEGSIGVRESSELAVMCDTYKPLLLTKSAVELEDADYHFSWVNERGVSPWQEKRSRK